jgi:hypothetical protein
MGFHYLSDHPVSYPDLGGTQASSHPTRGLRLPDKHDQHRGLEGQKHLLSDGIRYGY